MFYYYYRQPAVVHQLLPALYLLFLMRQIRSGHAWERHTVHRHRPAARRFSLPPNGVGDLAAEGYIVPLTADQCS